LLAFHRKHYRPENLTVVIAGPQSLDELQRWIMSRFASMKDQPFPLDKTYASIAEKLIEDAAQNIPSYHFTAPTVPFQPAFHPNVQKSKGLSWPMLVTNKPIRSMRKLVLMFPVPSTCKVIDQSPVSLLSHLLGHEGPGSSFAILQNLGWISSLSAGSRVSAPDFTLFQIDLALTLDGEQHWKDVVRVIFLHCQLINKIASAPNNDGHNTKLGNNNDLARIWGEKALLGAMFFQQASPSDVYSFAPSLCNSIVLYGTEKCLAAGAMIHENSTTFPYESFTQFAQLLVPSNCFIERCSKAAWEEIVKQYENINNTNDAAIQKRKEPWYSIEYFLSQLHVEDTQHWCSEKGLALESMSLLKDVHQQIALPLENNYIPRSLELCAELSEEAKIGHRIEKEIDPPNLIVDNEVGCLWHRLDDRYALPKSSLTFLIRNAAIENVKVDGVWRYDSSAAVHSSLLDAIFSTALAQETYNASLAGLSWNLSLSTHGIHLQCSGFSDRLPDLALKVLDSFLFSQFMKESYFSSAKDRLERNLQTYFESRRADAHAFYYRNFLLSSVDMGIDEALTSLKKISLDSIKAHHASLFLNKDIKVDCLFSGNISSKEAMEFFTSATEKLKSNLQRFKSDSKPIWCPGSVERRLSLGNSIELHFQSKNSQEENGSVVVTYQSSIPGYRGPDLSSKESLRSSAAIRLLCQILREPLFDELRTKQTLGYIVSSYYDIGTSSAPSTLDWTNWSSTVDYLVISVLSRKLAPPDVLARIDEFLLVFREMLVRLSDSEIENYSAALSAMLLKPIQKLSVESATQFSKIRRFAPEIQGASIAMPWDNAKLMAKTIQSLGRTDLVETWDRLTQPRCGTRIVSCVYGTTFPLVAEQTKLSKRWGQTAVIVNNLDDIVNLRKKIPVYDTKVTPLTPLMSFKIFYQQPGWLKLPHFVTSTVSSGTLRVAVILLGAGFIATGWNIMNRPKKNTNTSP
jgi:insulysin